MIFPEYRLEILEISSKLDAYPVQDSFRFRARHLGLKIASFLIKENGELNVEGLLQIKDQRYPDMLIDSHLRSCLEDLSEEKEVWAAIKRFSVPLCHKKAEEVIRETLYPQKIRRVETVHVRRAVLAAWLTILRQSTGSCFATAPAIFIQREYPLQFFKDLYELLATGQMKRVILGDEYSAPMSLSSGDGDLKKKDRFWDQSYGFTLALKQVGVEIAPSKIREFKEESAENLFRALLLEQNGLSEEDLRDEEQLSRIQMSALIAKEGAVYYQKPSERALRVTNWQKQFREVCLAFKTLTECALLRTWEYSLASFSDVKTEFARWNLYIGLGIHPDEKDGIGEFLYKIIDERLQKCNEEIEKLTVEYEERLNGVRALEVMLQNTTSEMRYHQLLGEYKSLNLTLSSLTQMREQLLEKGEKLSQLFVTLIRLYDEKFQQYFQELFDPSLHDQQEGHLYDDSAAGFRLVYKHGRLDASQWTAVYNAEEYIGSLRDFFSSVEGDEEIATALIQFIQSDQFLNAALQRAKARGRNSPWDYISGGTLQTLLQIYCARSAPFKEESFSPHSAQELFSFLKKPRGAKAYLMHSPTHAFIFYPDLLTELSSSRKKPAWDEIIQEHLANRLSERLPPDERALFLHLMRQKGPVQSSEQYRLNLIDALSVRNKEELVDSMLYEETPVYDRNFAKNAANHVLKILGSQVQIDEIETNLLGPYRLYQIIKTALPIDGEKIVRVMRKERLCQESSLFADTNWSNWFFGFVHHPVSCQLELWRLSRDGMRGVPMKGWINESAWVILSDPREYSFEKDGVNLGL